MRATITFRADSRQPTSHSARISSTATVYGSNSTAKSFLYSIARLTSRILQQFGVEVPLDTFFDTPTIREIAAVVVAGGEVATCSA